MRRTQQLFFGRPICAPAGVGNLRAHARMLGNPYCALYVSAADRYRQRAADTKNRAAQAKDLSIKSAFEHVAAGWVALAEQVKRIDREKFPLGDEKDNG